MQIQIKNSYTMKKLFLLMALFGVLCAGCSEPNDPIDTPQDPTEKPGNDTGNGDGGTTFITDADGNVVVEAEGGDVVVTVTTNIEYDVVIPEDAQAWLSVADTRGELRMEKLTFTVAENDFEERSANVELVDSAGKSLQTIKFTQRAFEKVFESDGEDSYVIEAKGGDIQVNVTTNIEYSVNIPDDAQAWLSVADTRAVRNERLTFTVAENYAEERSAVVTLLDGDKQELQIINIIQESAIISCANNEIIYTTKYGYPIELSVTTGFGGNVVSHTYENGHGKIVFDNDVQTIPSSAFKNCNSITTITLPDSVTSIESYAFDGCNSLTSVIIPESVISIGKCAFDGCTGELIVNCNIPSASSSSYGAFYNSKFTKVTIGDSVTSIGKYAFYGCTGELIINCNIPSASDYDEGAFYNSKFTKVTIGDSVTSIGDYTFCGCSSLTSITIPESVTSIGRSAFYGCSSLTSITIPNSVTTIGRSAFYGCSSLTSITIPNSVTEIGYRAFYGCSSLTSITIPNSVTTIEKGAFEGCSSLTSITIPDSVTSIGDSAFSGCSSLTSITIPESVTTIESSAFSVCSSLTSITIPDSVTSIEYAAFRDCSSLKSITIPDSVTTIREWAFYNCSSLTSVYCKSITTPVGGVYMFDGNASGRKIYVPTESVNAYKSAEYWSDYKNYIVGYDF